jgi:hypothetical protein
MSNSVSSSPVVRRRRRAEVSTLVKNFQQSGQRLSDFCQQHQIAPSTITRHMHRLQSSVASTSASPASSPSPSPHPAPPQLLPVDLVEDVQDRHPHRPASHTSPLVLELSGGHRVVLQHDFDESTLLRLIAVLGKA